jgi:hypothetical protein
MVPLSLVIQVAGGDVLPVAQGVWRPAVGPRPATEAVGEREYPVEELLVEAELDKPMEGGSPTNYLRYLSSSTILTLQTGKPCLRAMEARQAGL